MEPNISDFPSNSKIWIFPITPLPEKDFFEKIIKECESFLKTWQSHGSQLRASLVEVPYPFIGIAVDESQNSASGCSQDALLHFIQNLETTHDLKITKAPPVAFIDQNGEFSFIERKAFIRLLKKGETFHPQTKVFDWSITRLNELKDQGLEKKLSESWHHQLYLRHSPAEAI